MLATLIAIGGPQSGVNVPLTAAEISIGSDQSNDLALADPSVSPRHCIVAASEGRVTLRDVDRENPSFVNGLPASGQPLDDGDQIQIGGSLFVLRLRPADLVEAAAPVRVKERSASAAPSLVMRREEVFAAGAVYQAEPAGRLSRDLAALIRIGATVSAVHGLVALERPLIELVAEVVPADRGAVILSGDRGADLATAVGWTRGMASPQVVHVSRPVMDRVLRDVVGVVVSEPADASGANPAGRGCSVLAAPLVAFDMPLGAIVLEADGPDRFDEAHLRFVMAVAGMAATALGHARHVERLEDEKRHLQASLDLHHNMIGESAPMRDVYRRIARVAPTDSTVLVTGESGTGKELVARAIHRNSRRADRPFVAINCAAITETLLESELFGHEKGAFTGAVAQKKGKLEMAEGGTVFLDEIGELSPALQAKLLRVLQERAFDRVGGTRAVHVDFRLIAATNRDLETAVAQGAFRRDLYYRLNVVLLWMPPLRDRADDIPLLAGCFARRLGEKAGRLVSGFSAEALACLMAYDWPGNVRQLENAVEHAVVLGSTPTILPEDLPEVVAEAGASASPSGSASTGRFHDAIKEAKKDLIVRAVEKSGGNYTAAARLLGLDPNYLHRLIRTLQLKDALKSSSS